MRVCENVRGRYRFIEGIAAYSGGIVAEQGHEVAHVALHQAVPWREGFEIIDAYLASEGHPRQALCGTQLRCPEPYSFGGFDAYNEEYRSVLDAWDVCVDGLNPVARSNVAPVLDPPDCQSLYAFSYVRPASQNAEPSFVVAGSGEYDEATGIHRDGDASADGLRAKASYVMDVMSARLTALGVGWSDVTRTNVYTAHATHGLLDVVWQGMGAASEHGVHHFYTRPPIVGIEFEMDLRGVAHEHHLRAGGAAAS
jgi:hypothetical protein